ncbi:type II toxin-antitoxin system RelE/ParE family toxin [Rhizobium hainanense]|uniref:Plasmid stabilization system protein ParE n=1 Tax=Rhizobium hainanense TaxID=52131 RepID=A0A1C3WL13_9HYPH|nr:Plasmid stabilization system protein ParE [Rhizobium hainanense]
MGIKLVWSPQAEDDVINIYVEIGLHQPQAAERYYEQFRQNVGLLADQPRLGQRHPEIAPTARILVQAPHVILYERSQTPIKDLFTRYRLSVLSMAGAICVTF